MEDGFFSDALEKENIAVVIPNSAERQEMQNIHEELMKNVITRQAKDYFRNLMVKYKEVDAVIIACSEWRLIADPNNSPLPVIDTLHLQCEAAVEFSLS